MDGDSWLASKAYAHQTLHVDSVARIENDEEPITITLED